MLSYFRINDPYRLLGLLVVLVLIALPLLIDAPGLTMPELKSILTGEKVHEGHAMYTELVESRAPLAALLDGLFDLLFGRSLLGRHILALFIIFFQAGYLGIVFISKKAFAESTFIPALLFGVLFFFSFDNLSLSPELLGSGVLMLALHNLFRQVEFREQRDGSIFNLGFYIGIASLFSFSFIVHLLGATVILAMFTRSTFRHYMLMIFGFTLPHLLLMSLYFLNDGLAALWQYYYLPNLAFDGTSYMASGALWMLAILPLAFLAVSLVMLNRDARFTKYQSQVVQAMFFWMVFSFLQALYSKEIRPQSFIAMVPSVSFFMAHFLLLIRRRKFADISLWIFIGGIVAVLYLTRYGYVNTGMYDRLLVGRSRHAAPIAGKKLLVLDDDLSAYKNNTLGSPFLNWQLSREIFVAPAFYEHVIAVDKAFRLDAPDVIVDPNGLLPEFLRRIPALQQQYRLTAPGIYGRKETTAKAASN